MGYLDFIEGKLRTVPPSGFEPRAPLSAALYPFQRETVSWALRRGRSALFEDCGLGKTLQELEWARHVAAYTGGRTLIFAPLAVAQQTIREGNKFGFKVDYARDRSEVRGPITIANYERLEGFDSSEFAGVVLDESSILKAFMGKTKRRLLDAFERTPFKLCGTATPAPNDHLELGNHAEFLGVLTSHEMIARWFINDTSTFGTYRLKGHAVEPFWDWVASWARCIGRPSDLGEQFSDEGYILPPLDVVPEVVSVDVVSGRAEGKLFRVPELSATSVHKEKRITVEARAARVAKIVRREPDEPWVIWIDTDYEAEAVRKALPGVTEVHGSDSPEEKEKALVDFTEGRVRHLMTKPKIGGWGLNWQHCARCVYIGPSFSFEQKYQTLRRFWRFGQVRPVRAHVVMAETELPVWEVAQRKAADHEDMKRQMFAAMRRAQAREDRAAHPYTPTHRAALPGWIRSAG